jgi:hypothetical protein
VRGFIPPHRFEGRKKKLKEKRKKEKEIVRVVKSVLARELVVGGG